MFRAHPSDPVITLPSLFFLSAPSISLDSFTSCHGHMWLHVSVSSENYNENTYGISLSETVLICLIWLPPVRSIFPANTVASFPLWLKIFPFAYMPLFLIHSPFVRYTTWLHNLPAGNSAVSIFRVFTYFFSYFKHPEVQGLLSLVKIWEHTVFGAPKLCLSDPNLDAEALSTLHG